MKPNINNGDCFRRATGDRETFSVTGTLETKHGTCVQAVNVNRPGHLVAVYPRDFADGSFHWVEH